MPDDDAPETPAEESSPDPVALLEQERAERLRLEGETRRLQAELEAATRPAPAPKDPLTADEVQRALDAGEVTQGQALRLFAKIEGRAAALETEREREDQAALRRANAKIAAAVVAYPALKDRNSPLMRQVDEALRVVERDEGMNPEDPRAQALALERVVGRGKGAEVDDREYDRLRRSGGVGGFGNADDDGRGGRPQPTAKSKGERIWNSLLPEFQTFYLSLRGTKELAIKTLEYADEAMLRKAGRMA